MGKFLIGLLVSLLAITFLFPFLFNFDWFWIGIAVVIGSFIVIITGVLDEDKKPNESSNLNREIDTNVPSTIHNSRQVISNKDTLIEHKGNAIKENQTSLINSELKSNTVTDIDGNVYKTVQIGNQIWMAENLRVSRYRNGDLIPNVQENKEWSNLKTGAWCNYENNPDYDSEYGKLYNWYAVDDNRGLAPKGWHIPSKQEWLILTDSLGGRDIAGGKLKKVGKEHIDGTTNESRFSALLGGIHNDMFYDLSATGYWWCATDYGNFAWYKLLFNDSNYIGSDYNGKSIGISLRCVMDSV